MLIPRGKLTIIDYSVLGFAAVTILSSLLSPFDGMLFIGRSYEPVRFNVWLGMEERFDGAVTQLLFVAIYFIVSRWYKPSTKDFILFGISAGLVALIGILQFYGMDFLKLWPNHVPEYYRENYYDIFFRSTLGNINIVSTYVCVTILFTGFLFIRTPEDSSILLTNEGLKPHETGIGLKAEWRYLWLAASALCFWMMDLANSDSGLVGVAAASFLAIPLVIENRKTLGRFLILISTWVYVFALQMYFYDVSIREIRTAAGMIPFFIVVVLLAAGGVVLIRWKSSASGTEKSESNAEHPVSNTAQPARWKLGIIIIVSCIAAGLLAVEFLGRQEVAGGYGRFIYEAREIMHGNIRDELGTNRIYIWRNALAALPNDPVIGTGPDTFVFAFPQEAHGFYGENYDKAHNEYIQILICQGILGLLCYMTFLGGVFVKGLKRAFRNPLAAAALVAFTGYCVQAIFNISLPIASQMLWVLAGMLASTQRDKAADSSPLSTNP